MSQMMFPGFDFSTDLQKSWRLKNTVAPVAGETQEMGFALLNSDDSGFKSLVSTLFGDNPFFTLKYVTSTSETDILKVTDSKMFPLKPINMGGLAIKSLLDPVDPQDAATMAWTLAQIGGYTPPAQGITLTGDVTGSGFTGAPLTTTFTKRLDQIAIPTAPVNLNNQRITNLLDPTSPQDAATRAWTLAQIGGAGYGTVTSVGISNSGGGLVLTGSPVTTSGIMNINLSGNLSSLNSLASVGILYKPTASTYGVVPAGTAGKFLKAVTANTYDWDVPPATGVTSVALSNLGGGISILGSPITSSGTITLQLASNLTQIAALSSLGLLKNSSSGFGIIPDGTSGQFLKTDGSNNLTWASIISSIGISVSPGMTVSGSPLTSNGSIALGLNTELIGLSALSSVGLFYRTGSGAYSVITPGLFGQSLQVTGANSYGWVTPAGGGNVTGPSSSNLNRLTLFDNLTGTLLKQASFGVDSGGNLDLSSLYRIKNLPEPAANSEAATLTTTYKVRGFSNLVDFKTPGATSWTVPANCYHIKATLIGGGASGGSSPATGRMSYGGSGGAGAACIKFLSVTPGDSISLSIGDGGAAPSNTAGANGNDGGDTSLSYGAINLVAGGGKQGLGASNTVVSIGTPANGGTASGGDINMSGGKGMPSFTPTSNSGNIYLSGSRGGANPLFPATADPGVVRGDQAVNPPIGDATDNTGEGGAGGLISVSSPSVVAGKAGSKGRIMIEW